MAENSPSFVHQQMYEERAVFYAPLRTAHVYRRKAIVGLAHPSGVQPAYTYISRGRKSFASPRKMKKPSTSVAVVTKIDEDTAGSA